MENNKTTFEVIMENCPFLKTLIQDKIAEEIAVKDSEIADLQDGKDKLNARLTEAERQATEATTTQQELLEALIEGGVI